MPMPALRAHATWHALLVAVLGVSAAPAAAQPVSEDSIPPSLRPWIPWALEGSSHRCAFRDGVMGNDANPVAGLDGGGEPICVWPGDLVLVVAADGGTFSLDATSDHRAPLTLPGSGRHWPIDVQVDGRAAIVLALGGRPVVWIEAGQHRVSGRFAWSAPPDTLLVPDAVARVMVTRAPCSCALTCWPIAGWIRWPW